MLKFKKTTQGEIIVASITFYVKGERKSCEYSVPKEISLMFWTWMK